MSNFKGKMTLPYRYVYKNGTPPEVIQNKTEDDILGRQEEEIFIPNINNLDLSKFTIYYSPNDTQKLHPYYVYWYKENDFSDLVTPTTEKIDLNAKMTLFSSEKNNIVATFEPYTVNEQNNNTPGKVLKIGYGLIGPGVNHGSSFYGISNNKLVVRLHNGSGDGISAQGGTTKVATDDTSVDLINRIFNGNIQGLPIYFNQDRDAYFSYGWAETKKSTNPGGRYNVFYRDSKDTNDYFYINQMDKSDEGKIYTPDDLNYSQNWNGISSDITGTHIIGMANITTLRFNLKKINDTTRSVVNFRIPILSWIGNDNKKYTDSYGQYLGHSFLIDDEKNIYIMLFNDLVTSNGLPSSSQITEGNQIKHNITVTMCKIDDLPQGGNVGGLYSPEVFIRDGIWYDPISSNTETVSELVYRMLNPEEVPDEDYNDGGADIVGPGDSYEGLDNDGDIVGGDPDLTEVIEKDEATPNTSYTSFGTSTGYFGSYVVTNDDLKEYTDTLKLLYENSVVPVIGVAYSTIADRMTNSITSMIMIPKEIPSEYKLNRIFALGNCGVKNPNATWNDYILGKAGAYANSDLLMNSILQWTVQLDPLYHFYDNYLDFAPYSTASIYIPYIGMQTLPINLIQSTKTKIIDLKLSFRLNCINGDLMCILMVDGVPMTHWNGNCARIIKVSVNDDSSAIREGVNGILSMVSMISGKGGMSSISMGSGTPSGNNESEGNGSQIVSGIGQGVSSAGSVASLVPSLPSSITSSQHLIGGGCNSGEMGWIDTQNIYITVERPQWWRPNDYGDLIGYPTKKITRLGSVSGFARVPQCHVRCSGTTTEKSEIMAKLAEGVIF